jgi:branched-subunit amino acid aminotransferase/4-amino-4-deoxychorismate lyase
VDVSSEKNPGYVFLDGRLVRAEEAVVSVFDRGFTFGDALVETMKLHNGRPVFFPEHYARLAGGMEEAGIGPVPADSALWRAAIELAEANGLSSGRLRLQVTRGMAPPEEGPEPGRGHRPTLLLTAQPFTGYPDSFYLEGMACATVPVNRGAWASLKTSSLMTTVLARRRAREAGADEAIFTSVHGELLEGAYSNIFFRQDGRCYATPAAGNILPGITRAAIMAVMRSMGEPVAEKPLRLEGLAGGGVTAFLSGSLLGFCPVRRIDGHTLAPDHDLAARVNEDLGERERESVSRTYG